MRKIHRKPLIDFSQKSSTPYFARYSYARAVGRVQARQTDFFVRVYAQMYTHKRNMRV